MLRDISITVAIVAVSVAATLIGIACDSGASPASTRGQSTMTITSTAFANGKTIPLKYTGDGQDVSPPLAWDNLPDGIQQLVLICDDPDAPGATSPWVHWVIYGIGPDVDGLAEAIPTDDRLDDPPGAMQGLNSANRVGYRGPAPPKGHGPHHYRFTLYALDAVPAFRPRATREEVDAAIYPHVLAEAQLVGIYER